MKIIIELIGYIGMICTLVAYFGLERGKIKSSGFLYPILNSITGICFLIVGSYTKTYSIALLNLFWLIISISLYIKNYKNIAKRLY